MRSGDLLIVGGVILIAAGLLWRAGWFGWFGNLPGDIRIEGERNSVFIPITSMILISIVGSVVLGVAGRFFRGE